jgi:hypothetical protein
MSSLLLMVASEKRLFGRFWAFLHEDSWSSFVVTLVIAFVFIKWIFFPGLSFLTGSELPLVIVESCSMYHAEPGMDSVVSKSVYEDLGIGLEDTDDWDFWNGFSKGDIIFVVGADNVRVGDVIIFNAGEIHPIIHRVVSVENDPLGTVYSTMGDNNGRQGQGELAIDESQVVGKALFKVPAVGWAKLLFFEPFVRDPNKKGFC